MNTSLEGIRGNLSGADLTLFLTYYVLYQKKSKGLTYVAM